MSNRSYYESRIAEIQRELDAKNGVKKPTFNTSADVQKVLNERRNAAKLAEALKRTRAIEEINSQPFQAETNPFELLSTDEIVEFDRLQKRETAQRSEFEGNLVSFAQWVLKNPEVPASSEAADRIVKWCRDRGMSLAFSNLDRAWANLQAEGMRPDYSERNHAAHRENVEQLRAAGIQVVAPPDPEKATTEEIKRFLDSQPPSSLDNLQPPSTAPDLFAGPKELIDLQRSPANPEEDNVSISDLY